MKLQNQVGANAAVVGKITQREGEIRVDVKFVRIETGERFFEDYLIVKENDLRPQSQIAKNMRELSKKICAPMPKWPLYAIGSLAVTSVGTGVYAYLQGRDSFNKFKFFSISICSHFLNLKIYFCEMRRAIFIVDSL